MLLFDVPGNSKVLVRSQSIRLQILDGLHLPVAGQVEWKGVVTDEFFEFESVNRRLVRPVVDFYCGYGVWLRNVEVEVLD